MKSFRLESLKQSYYQTIQKVRLLGSGKEFMTKVTKGNKGWMECSKKLMSLSPTFSMPIFSSNEFSILRISCDSDNVKVTSTKTHPRGSLYVCYSMELYQFSIIYPWLQLYYQIESNILPTQLISACVSMCKTECENR